MRRPTVKTWRLAGVTALTAVVTAACGVGSASTVSGALAGPPGPPIKVGISLPLTGAFSADGLACRKGYQLWASDVNSHGGLLHRPVKLVIINDKSDPNTTVADYHTLIQHDHVDLVLAPFSSLLTESAAPVTHKLGKVLSAGSAGAPGVYALGLHDLFSTNVPASNQMVPLARWVLSLPAGERPVSAAYPMLADPFADPPVQTAQGILQRGGIKTVFTHAPYNLPTSPGKASALLVSVARQVAASGAQMVLLGTVDVPTVSAFIREFAKLHYNPKVFIASAGPDQGQAFLNAVGTSNAVGVMVPNGWYGNFPNALSHVMVQDYIAKYGGTAADINADVAESYSAAQVIAAGVLGTRGLNQSLIADWLHAHTIQTVTGPVKFNSVGENLDGQAAFIFQWQPGAHFVQVLPPHQPGSVPIIGSKPAWTG